MMYTVHVHVHVAPTCKFMGFFCLPLEPKELERFDLNLMLTLFRKSSGVCTCMHIIM